ncbi:MAG: ChaN family lipoprotein [Ideonella sp.]
MLLNRRDWLAYPTRWSLGLAIAPFGWLGACAAGSGTDGISEIEGEQIQEVRSGRTLNIVQTIERIRHADVVLLGELHDNPHHHQRRADLLTALGMPIPVVVEYLPRGATPSLLSSADAQALLQALERVGFDAEGWQWPLHQPLFAAIARSGDLLRGGNLPRETTRRVAREGIAALPVELQAILQAAPLAPTARRSLERDLQDGHCGQLGASHLPAMVAVQRGRDAAMALALITELDAWRSKQGRGPVLLLAGNGHVRRDYGVPQLLAAQRPELRLLAIEFAEPPQEAAPPDAPFDIVWKTPMAVRGDPCAAFTAPKVKKQSAFERL